MVPLIHLSKLLTQFDAQYTARNTSQSRTQFTSSHSHTWPKCRHAAPKTSQHHGVVRSSSGAICTTTSTLDQALRATHSFWQDMPLPHDPEWDPLLSEYSLSTSPFPAHHTLISIILWLLLQILLRAQTVFLILPGWFARILLLWLSKISLNVSFTEQLPPHCNLSFSFPKPIKVTMQIIIGP